VIGKKQSSSPQLFETFKPTSAPLSRLLSQPEIFKPETFKPETSKPQTPNF